MQRTLILAAALALTVSSAVAQETTEFPYRTDYPNAKWITTDDLHARVEADTVVIIDVRSTIEYDVIHPVNSLHIPLNDENFIGRVQEIVKANPDKALAFYCNGVTCLKSYEATEKAVAAGITSCYAYDAGIPEWARVFPELTLLMGTVLTQSRTQLIPDEDFQSRCLEFKDFVARSSEDGAMVVDVRDLIQKSGELPGLHNRVPIPLDKFIPKFVEKKLHQDKTLLVYDQVGKQVRWLQYYLEANGYKSYYFLKKGATEVLKEQKYK